MEKSQADCVFCKIVNGDIPSAKFYEDEEVLGILDINPNTEGASVVLSKHHFSSNPLDLEDHVLASFMIGAKRAANVLSKSLETPRIAMSIEGMGINHFHIRLFPLHKSEEFIPDDNSTSREFYNKYPGFITTKLGPTQTPQALKQVLDKILK